MMFIASKLLAFALEPLFWVLFLLLGGLLLLQRRPRLGKGLAWGALLALVASTWTPLPLLALHTLEMRFPQPPAGTDMRQFVGVVVLGGALSRSEVWVASGQVALNEHAERMTTAVALARKHPHLKLLYTGGIASLDATGLTEAVRARIFFDEMGVNPEQVLYEDKSRNTFENAIYSARLPGVDKAGRWLLLTSANHMPRSMGVFTRAGWNVTPYPVDYGTTSELDWLDFSMHFGPRIWQSALHEMLGYYAYRWFDKI
jgi:uncharacterized SAM-binding protein YcdF (DUF218 family)